MPGFGLDPFGTGPYGLGTPTPGAAPATGASGCRYINPATKDFQQDPATGQLAQMPAQRQRVLLALTTLIRSSSVLPAFGIEAPRKMGTFFVAEMKNAVRAALRHMTEVEQTIRIDSIEVLKGSGGRSRTTVSFTDLTTGEDDALNF